MCQELDTHHRIKGKALQKIADDIKDGVRPYNQADTPYVIARTTLNSMYDGVTEAADFETACALEKLLIKAGIGTPQENKPRIAA